MNILVVGGTGFFGIPMVEKLLADRHEVTIATRGNAKNPFQGMVNQILLDRTDADSVKRALHGEAYDVIIDKVAYCSNDVRTLLSHVCCEHYIQMSSCSVYAEDRERIREDAFDPRTHHLVWTGRDGDYAEGKRQAERAALEYLEENRCTFVRYPMVLGEKDGSARLRFYKDHIAEEKPMYVDDLDSSMAFIHENEAGSFLAHLVTHRVSGAVNGCSEGMVSPRNIIAFAEKLTGKKALLDEKGDPAPFNGATANISYDTTKAQATGFRFSKLEDWIYEILNY